MTHESIEDIKNSVVAINEHTNALKTIVAHYCTIVNHTIEKYIQDTFEGKEPKNFRSDYFKKDFPGNDDNDMEFVGFFVNGNILECTWADWTVQSGLEEKHCSINLDLWFKGDEEIANDTRKSLNMRKEELDERLREEAKKLTKSEIEAYRKIKSLVEKGVKI